MANPSFTCELEVKVEEQLQAQRVGYLLGAGSSYLGNTGYPLTVELWDLIRDEIADTQKRSQIEVTMKGGATGIEDALDQLDDGGAIDTPYRHLVTDAIASHFMPKNPSLNRHIDFVRRISNRPDPSVKVFNLNYDPLVERAAEAARVRLSDGFLGAEHAFFAPEVFEERIGQIRGTYKGRQFDETVKPIHLMKLHGSLGWYDCPQQGARRCAYGLSPPSNTKRLMIPPHYRVRIPLETCDYGGVGCGRPHLRNGWDCSTA